MPVNVRIPDDLSAILTERARAEDRSLSNLIVSVLRQYAQRTTFPPFVGGSVSPVPLKAARQVAVPPPNVLMKSTASQEVETNFRPPKRKRRRQ
jgi:hypothetical protein